MPFERSDSFSYASGVDGDGYPCGMTLDFLSRQIEADACSLNLTSALDWVETESDLRHWIRALLLPHLQATGILVSIGEVVDTDNWKPSAMIVQAVPRVLREALFATDAPLMAQFVRRWLPCRWPVGANLKIAENARRDVEWLPTGAAGEGPHRISVGPVSTPRHSCDRAGCPRDVQIRVRQVADGGHALTRLPKRQPEDPDANGIGAYTTLLHGAIEPTGRRGILLLAVLPERAHPTRAAMPLAALAPVFPRLYCKTAGIRSRQPGHTDALSPSDATDLHEELSKAETEVLTWIARGKTNWEISRILSKSESTVKKQVASAMKKLSVTRRAQIDAALVSTVTDRDGLFCVSDQAS